MPPPKKPARRNHDYIDLFPGRVFPTGGIDVLERGNNLLFIKSYEHGKKIEDPHRKIWKLLVRFGENPDAPGSISVVCVWGLADAEREVILFDGRGEQPVRTLTRDGWRQWLDGWWSSNKGHR